MLKELLSDFSIIAKPTYQPENFSPYLTTIITIVTVTLVVFSVQTIVTSLYSYSNNPTAIRDTPVQADNCENFSFITSMDLCNGSNMKNYQSYIPGPSITVEHDLHSLMN